MKKILLLMSGGVDSSVAGYLLKKNWDVVGVTMKTGSVEPLSAQKVAESLNIPHYTLETEEIFKRRVVEKAIEARENGLTPNPCADCNKALKFGHVVEMMRRRLDCDFDIATGHYARIIREGTRAYLARAAYSQKDQSYFLCDIPREILPKLHFPLGEMTKAEVREIAREAGLEVAEKPESMDGCFELPRKNYAGEIVNLDGQIVGKHSGVFNYTVGQRKGLGIAHTEPLFVLKIDEAKNQLIVGTREQALAREVEAENPNVLAPDLLSKTPLFAKTRSKGEPAACELTHLDGQNLRVCFSSPTFAPTPGQRLVCHDERGILVVSGVITTPRVSASL